jgi:UDP-N-acetyl-2-amino-2-deoxyglucuronate dehydrogenase
VSWKGSPERSGGIIVNIGIHFFDLLLWLFGPVQVNRLHLLEPHRASGFLELTNARVRWFLSTNPQDLPEAAKAAGRTTFRAMIVDGREVEFSDGFADLHTDVYRQILAGQGPGIDEARPSIRLAHDIRHAAVQASADVHPMLAAAR